MPSTKIFYLAFYLLLSSFFFAQPNLNSISIKNPSFEITTDNNIPLNWNYTNKDFVSIDNNISVDETNSISIIHEDWEKSIITSEPVELIIGELYMLSAWIKTKDVTSNPLDRYPTSVAGCVTMQSFPFTNHSTTIGATKDWTIINIEFIATEKSDRIRLHLGYNGTAKGEIWFDNVELKKVNDISNYIPFETVQWFGEGFRYDDRGWINVHIEGKPYERGYQYGYLVAEEIVEYINKLGIQVFKENPEDGWDNKRFVADAFMLRKYEKEYLTEMKGIADGVNKAEVKLFDRELDLIDIVTMNSAIDIDYAGYAMRTTPNPLSGENFLRSEDELNIPERLHKCSSFLANNSSTTDGRIVFGQIFMWGGYTGPHWNVICDVKPEKGNRLVYQTFPGGIHSGADFYINESGIMIGETTVSQTPLNPDGSPQSNRIRKAAQYANSIDDVVNILTKNNNGMYANDWLIGDTKTDEIAVLLLGTKKHKLWRSGNNEFYGNTNDFYWCNNNNKDPEVRKEYISNKDNAPHDLIFTPWNRDIAFNQFYKEQKGNINATVGVNAWNTSPINRPHACDGKVTTSDMAEKLVFFANSGKVTLREKFINENGRIPDLPGATPRLSLGYAVSSPIFIEEQLKKQRVEKTADFEKKETKLNFDSVEGIYSYNKRSLWFNTVFPSSDKENWFISATAAYWKILKKAPEEIEKSINYYSNQFAELTSRYNYVTNREGSIAPINAERIYTRYNNYQIPRIKGTFLLHQLRLLLGDDTFSLIMNTIHDEFKEKEITTSNFIEIAENASKKSLSKFIMQWLERDDLPNPEINANIVEKNGSWILTLVVNQGPNEYHYLTTVEIETEEGNTLEFVEIKNEKSSYEFVLKEKPKRIIFNKNNDVLLKHNKYFTWSNFFDDYSNTIIVYGTKRQIEANHTLALRFSKTLADKFTETLIPVKKDSEVSEEDLAQKDFIIVGNVADNNLTDAINNKLSLSINKNSFEWLGKSYSNSDHGLFISSPNPFNKKKAIYLFTSNSALQLYNMTNKRHRLPSWGIFHKDKVVKKGYHINEDYVINL